MSVIFEKKNEKMHHWIPHKILHEKDCIVNFSKFFLGWPKFLQDYNTSTAFIVLDGFSSPCYFILNLLKLALKLLVSNRLRMHIRHLSEQMSYNTELPTKCLQYQNVLEVMLET